MASTVITRSSRRSPGLMAISTGWPYMLVWVIRNRRISVPENPTPKFRTTAAPHSTGQWPFVGTPWSVTYLLTTPNGDAATASAIATAHDAIRRPRIATRGSRPIGEASKPNFGPGFAAWTALRATTAVVLPQSKHSVPTTIHALQPTQ